MTTRTPHARAAVEPPNRRLAPALRPRGYVLGKANARRVTTVIVMSLVTLVVVFVEGPRRMTMSGGSKVESTIGGQR